MAAHVALYPSTDAEAFVRGDPAAFIIRISVLGVDQDITSWTWRSHVRANLAKNAQLISECVNFSVTTPAAMTDVFPGDTSTVPCVLIAQFTGEETANWHDGFVSDVEELTPAKRTWVIMDHLRVDEDASHTEDLR